MNENQHEFPDELISAYLDGELSPAEKVRVEEQLMDSADHRRLFEELKALRRSLQSLPAETLAEDFAARVLRRAERELLADGTPVDKSKAKEAAAKPVVVEAPPVVARPVVAERGNRRGLVWSIIATAAAVGLLTFGPLWNRPTHNVSRLNETETAPTTEGAKQQAAPAEQISSPVDDAKAKNGVELGGTPFVAPAPESATFNDHQFKESGNRSGESQSFDSAHELRMRDEAGQKAEANSIDGASRYNASARFSNGSRGPANAETAPGAVAKDRAEHERQLATAEKAAAEHDAEPSADGSPSLGKAGIGDVAQAFGGGAAGGRGALTMQTREQLQLAPSARIGVVTLDVKREALAGKFFDQLLARHDIRVELARADDEVEQLAREDRKNQITNGALADAIEVQADAGSAAGEGEGGAALRGGQDASDDLADRDDASELGSSAEAKHDAAGDEHADVDLMFVQATPEQIDALLRDLEAQQGDVVAMAFDGVGPAKKGGLDEGQPQSRVAERGRQFRALADLKQLELSEQATLAAKMAEQNAASPAVGEKPQASAAGQSPVDQVVASNIAEPQLDARASETAKSSVARRISLQSLAQAEKQLRRGGSAAATSAPIQPEPAPPAVLTEAPAEVRPTELAEEAAIEAEDAQDAPMPPLAVAPAVEGATPSAPPANQPAAPVDKLSKAKEQGLVRVLFVLRAVSPPAVEAGPAPADAAPAEPQK